MPSSPCEYSSWEFDFLRATFSLEQPQITRQSLSKLSMPIVCNTEQRKSTRYIDASFTRMGRLAAEVAYAQQLTDALGQRILAKGFAGGLVVARKPDSGPAGIFHA